MKVDPSQQIRLHFLEFATEAGWDKLHVSDGVALDVDLDGTRLPDDITTHGNYVKLE